jgi:tetratricopeptide (TPR) repeat protein
LRGNFCADLDRSFDAIADYSEFIARRTPGDLRALIYYNRAIVFEDLREYPKALIDYTRAIQLSPKTAEYYSNRANVYNSLGDRSKEMADYREAIRLDPNHLSAYVNRGATYFKEKQFDLALKDYNRAISLSPLEQKLYERRADIYEAKGMKDRAKADRDRAKQLAATPPQKEIVPSVVEIENGGSSGPGGVAWTAFDQERRNRHEERVPQTRSCWQGCPEGTAREAS